MSDDNKEGAGVPVTWEEVRDELAVFLAGASGKRSSFWHGPLEDVSTGKLNNAITRMRKLLSTPSAVMPAAPSDADALKQWAWHWFGPDADEEWIAKALANLPSAALSQTLPLRGIDQRALEVAASFIQLHAPDSPLYGDLRSIAARIQPAAGEQAGAVAYQGPKKFTAEEVADGNLGIRWVTAESVMGRPSSHDVMEYLKRNTGAMCNCERCRAFFPALAAPGAAIAAREQECAESYESIWNALQRIDSAAAMLPTYSVRHEGGIEAFTQNIIDALASREEAPATPQGEAVRKYPPMPEMIDLGDSGASNYGYSEDCMRAYVDADRAAPTEAPRESLPEPLKAVAWTYTHKISEAGYVSIWRWPIGHPARELHDEEELVRLTDAQSALESERQAHAAEVQRLRTDAERYRLLRRGQHWSVIDGMGYTLRAEQIDAAIDQAIARGKT